MIVCHCEQVNDRRLLDELGSGTADADELAVRSGAGTRCGGCRPTIEALVARVALAGQPAA
jgi:bacterioferritin-associated ferredoxin